MGLGPDVRDGVVEHVCKMRESGPALFTTADGSLPLGPVGTGQSRGEMFSGATRCRVAVTVLGCRPTGVTGSAGSCPSGATGAGHHYTRRGEPGWLSLP